LLILIKAPPLNIWAKGDIRFDRDSLQCNRRMRYDSLSTDGKPAYIIMPNTLKPNPTNDGLTNSFSNLQQYFSCSISANSSNCDCPLQPPSANSSWFIGVTNAKIKVPFFQGNWVDAKRVEFVELSLPPGENNLNAPYTNDINSACQNSSDGWRLYRGVREDWYFVDGVGPALIITRQIGMPPDNDCIYSVARESLTFQNSDTYNYLVEKDNNGYDSTWDYPLLPFPILTSTPTPTPTPTSIPATPTPTPTPLPTTTLTATTTPTATSTPKPTTTPGLTQEPTQPVEVKVGDITGDGKVDEADYAVLIANFGK